MLVETVFWANLGQCSVLPLYFLICQAVNKIPYDVTQWMLVLQAMGMAMEMGIQMERVVGMV